MIIGYIRVSTEEQNIDRQVEMLKQNGVDKVFIDKMSGKNTQRPALQEMMTCALPAKVDTKKLQKTK